MNRLLCRIWLLFGIVLCLALAPQVFGAFGVTSSGGYYIVDTGANPSFVFMVNQFSGDIVSLNFNGTEYQATDKKSQIASGLGSATVTATQYGNNYIKITIATSAANSVVHSLTHYLMVRNGDPIIYMATYVTAEPAVGELRWITRLQYNEVPNGPPQSDNNGTSGAIESTDVFGYTNGLTSKFGYTNGVTTSKYYGRQRAMELTYSGATGAGVGVWSVFDTRESSSGGPFYRDIENQGDGTNSDQEVYNYMNSGHQEPEAWRMNVLYGPYALVFTTGAPPTLPLDYSWIETGGLNLLGWVSATNRGAIAGVASGIPAGFQGVVGFANTNAQYWAVVASDGTYTTPLMKPGTYNVTLYKGELPVTNNTVTVTVGTTNTLNLTSGEPNPSYIFKIGEWDGTPAGFLNASNIINMHPSDIRCVGPFGTNWGPVIFIVGSNVDGDFPAIQMRKTNSPTTILFNLDPTQFANFTLRIGMTCTYNNGRPSVTINGHTLHIPGISVQPNSRSFTVGTWRGNDTNEIYSIPAADLVAGWNTLLITPASGSSDLGPWLSAGWVYDAVELDNPPPPDVLQISPNNGFLASFPLGIPTGAAVNFTLTNAGASSLNWSLVNTSLWLNASAIGGTLAVGGQTTVTVSLNATAANFPVGNYAATLFFTNQNTGIQQTRQFTLQVLPLILNSGFETGDFTSWTLSGNSTNTYVSGSSIFVHSGNYAARLGPVGSLGYLSETVPTVPGEPYVLSFWLENPDGGLPNEFSVSWNGNVIYDQTNLPAFTWTNLQFAVQATGSSSVVQFGARNDPQYFDLDDVSLTGTPLPAFQLLSASGNGLAFSWNAVPGSVYQLQYNTNLLQTNWINLGGALTAADTTLSVTNLMGPDPQRFYRLQVLQ